MITHRRLRRTVGLGLCGAALAPALAGQGRDSVGDTVTLAPIVVTAARRAQSLFAVPLAMTRISRDAWQATRAAGLDDALSLVPGVLAQSRYGTGDVRLVIRGFGARGAGDRSNAGTSRGVRVLLDGFPETEPDGRTSFDGIDLASAHGIEVLRSNASSVWGNAAGGVVSISTVPDFERSLLSTEAAAGGFGLRRLALTAGGTAGPSRLAATVSHATFNGWRAHSGSRRTLINTSLLAPLGERTRLGVYALGTDNLFRIPGPLTAAQVAADPRQANLTYAQRDERRHNRLGRLGVRLDHDLGVATTAGVGLFVNPKYLQRSERGTFRDFTRYHVGGNATLETRALGGTLVTGIDAAYQDGAILFYSLTPAGTRGDTLRDDKREGALNLGGFAQQELTVGAHWVVVLGARYDVISYYSQNFLTPALDADKSFRGVTPKVGVTWRRTPTHSVYASVGGGVEAPAGNETDPASTFGQDTVTAINPLLEPIRSTTWEVGTRQLVTWPHGVLRALSYDVALYDTRVTNEIVPYRGGRFYFTAASARRRGAELGLTLHAAGGASLQTAVAVQHHRYGDYVVDSVHYGVPGAVADYGGNEVVGVPGLTYAASLAWAPAPLAPLQLRLGVQGTSSYFTDDANQVKVPAYRVASLTAATTRPLTLGPGLGLHGFVTVNNLFDRAYIASAFLNPDVVAGEPVAFEPGLPRNVVVGISLVRRPAP
ncbi:MAG TPA: TonB-dependent receptor [Gemmatimonadales bacterium]